MEKIPLSITGKRRHQFDKFVNEVGITSNEEAVRKFNKFMTSTGIREFCQTRCKGFCCGWKHNTFGICNKGIGTHCHQSLTCTMFLCDPIRYYGLTKVTDEMLYMYWCCIGEIYEYKTQCEIPYYGWVSDTILVPDPTELLKKMSKSPTKLLYGAQQKLENWCD